MYIEESVSKAVVDSNSILITATTPSLPVTAPTSTATTTAGSNGVIFSSFHAAQ